MTFISYAGNLEDVMLWRIFKNIKHGFYIDVGAYDPIIGSVTKIFYDHGWRGINIEPVQQLYQRLCTERPEDINLAVAAGIEDGCLPYYEIIPNTELSTLDSDIAERHHKNGLTVVKKTIPVMNLANICQQYAPQTIHFLKVDVERAEKSVLLGMDFQQYRPWVVVVEATIPNSQEECYTDWEYILLHNDYQYVYFDGVNRFYIACEKAEELKPYFSAPPNHFDYYQRYSEYCLTLAKNELEQERNTLTQINQELVQQNHRLEQGFRMVYASWQALLAQYGSLSRE